MCVCVCVCGPCWGTSLSHATDVNCVSKGHFCNTKSTCSTTVHVGTLDLVTPKRPNGVHILIGLLPARRRRRGERVISFTAHCRRNVKRKKFHAHWSLARIVIDRCTASRTWSGLGLHPTCGNWCNFFFRQMHETKKMFSCVIFFR